MKTTPKTMPEALTARERAAYLNLYIEQNRGRAPIRPAPRAGAASARVLRPLSKRFGSGTSALTARWADIVGPRYAKLSRPARLIGGKEGAALLIIARGPAAALLSANSDNILEKVNRFIGGKRIVRLKITQGEINIDRPEPPRRAAQNPALLKPKKAPRRGLTPSEESSLHNRLENITNDRLRQALEDFGRSVIGRQP